MAQEIVFRDNSDEVLDQLKTKKAMALFDIGSAAQGYAQDLTPVRTGSLAGSISVAIVENEDSVYIGIPKDYVSPQGQEPSKYARYVELGSRNNKAHHMLGKAATEHSDEYKEIAFKIMKD